MVTDEVRAEVETALRSNDRQLGAVFAALESGLTDPRSIVELTAVANTGAAGNLLVQIAAARDGAVPTSPSRARQTSSALRALLRDNPTLSPPARDHLRAVIDRCDTLATDARALAVEDAGLAAQSERLEADLAAGGVYVYTLPHYWRHPYIESTDLRLVKVGMTTGDAARRVREQATTGVPEDPILLRVYRATDGREPAELERTFHRVLDAAGHKRPRSGAGREWFATTLELLDVVAELLDLEIAGEG